MHRVCFRWSGLLVVATVGLDGRWSYGEASLQEVLNDFYGPEKFPAGPAAAAEAFALRIGGALVEADGHPDTEAELAEAAELLRRQVASRSGPWPVSSGQEVEEATA